MVDQTLGLDLLTATGITAVLFNLLILAPRLRPSTALRLPLANFFMFLGTATFGTKALLDAFSPHSNHVLLWTLGACALGALFLAATINLPHSPTLRALLIAAVAILTLVGIGSLRNPAKTSLYLAYSQFAPHAQVSTQDKPSLVDLAQFYYLFTPDLDCPQDNSSCIEVASQLRNSSGGYAFASKMAFYFIFFYSIFRYYGHVFEETQQAHRKQLQDYDLRQGVLAQASSLLALVVASFFALAIAGVNFSQLGLFGGLVAAGVTVALRDTLGNFAAGLVLLWDGSIRQNDVVTIQRPENPETGGTYGIVQDVRLRYTLIKDRDTVHRLIPNNILINSVIENWTHDRDKNVRLRVPVPVPYSADLKKVRNVLESSCYEVRRVLRRPGPKALLVDFGDSAIIFSLRFWINDPEKGIRSVISEVYSYVSERLQEEGISIPFPQLDVHVIEPDRNPATKLQHSLA